ncbi:MAG: deoxyribodipyrimidine photo-lyase, partial [Beijerinckiaceae bacterium]
MNIIWFRDDLRVHDNPALTAAARGGAPCLCLYIHEDKPAARALGGASRWWLHGALADLDSALQKRGAALTIVRGDAAAIFAVLAKQNISGVFWNRRYEASAIAADQALKTMLKERGIKTNSFNGALLHEPWEVAT